MLGIGWTEFIFIGVVLLVFLGPERLPEFVTNISRVIFKLKDASRELRNQLDEEVREISQIQNTVKQEIIDKVEQSYRDAEQTGQEIQEEGKKIGTDVKKELNASTDSDKKGW